MKPKIFSFFSGAGFLDLGFEMNKFKVVGVNEIYKPFADSYEFARQHLKISSPEYGIRISGIDEYLSGKQLKLFKEQISDARKDGSPIGFVGGPPCPDFSVAGKNLGKYGENGKLSKTYVDLIVKTRPDFFLFENVRGLWRTARHREFYEELKKTLSKAGYVLTERLINSLEYGAPQDRERIILIGVIGARSKQPDFKVNWEKHQKYSKGAVFALSWPTTEEPKKSRNKPNDIDPDLCVQTWFERNEVENHANSQDFFTPRAGLVRFQNTLEGDVSRKSFKRLHRWRYSPTAAYGNNEVHIHPYFARRISVAEALAIQSLPKDFILPPSMTLSAKFKAIGNGVPYLAAEGLARMTKKILDTELV